MSDLSEEGVFSNKNLLIIAQDYSTFTKNQVETIASSFKQVYVLPVYRPIAEISNFLPLDSLKPFRKKVKIDVSNLPGNITVIPTPLNYIPLKSWYKTVGDTHYKSVLKIIEKHNIRFDLIHCHFTYSSGYVGSKLKEYFKVPLVITAHGFDIYDLPFRSAYWQEKISAILKSADTLITVSRKNRDCIEKLGVKDSVEIIPNGYSEDLFFPLNKSEARGTLALPQDKKIIVTVGNLIAIKGQKYLVASLERLVGQYDNLLCLIIGGGSLRKKLQKQIIQLGLENHVQLVGEVAHADIHQWINASDFFVLPSLREGNPTVLFECMACGRPFIGSRVGGVPEIVDNEKLGLLFQPGNVEEMVSVLKRSFAAEWDESYILEHSRKYSWKRVSRRIVKSYEKIFTTC